MKTIEAVARLYRGVLVFETMTGFIVFGEGNQPYPFETRPEAEAFIDAWIVASMTVAVCGTMSMQ